jgi:hypothetical protein
MRKHPIVHRVKSHTRDGKKVITYVRGTRHLNPLHLSNPTINKPKGYTVTLIYSDKTREEQQVIATSYTKAIDEAFENKHNPNMPIEINVIDPSLGEIIHWAGDHAKKYGEIVGRKSIEYGKKAVEAGTNYAISKAKEVASDHQAKRLVEQSYSPIQSIRILARSKLQANYPEVWRTMDLSRS